MNRKILILAVLALVICGCDLQSMAEINLQNEEISISENGEIVLEYEPLKWQLSTDVVKGEYCLCNDEMNEYFILKVTRGDISTGCTADLVLKEKGKKEVTVKSLDFQVQKTEQNLVWLWNSSRRYALVCPTQAYFGDK